MPLLTVVAFVVSYRRRRERNFFIKVLLAFGALAALAMFFREVLTSLYDTRVPLARLFLWVQVTLLRRACPQGPLLLAGERHDPARRRRHALDQPPLRPVRARLPPLLRRGPGPDEPLRSPRASRCRVFREPGASCSALSSRASWRSWRSACCASLSCPSARDEPRDDADRVPERGQLLGRRPEPVLRAPRRRPFAGPPQAISPNSTTASTYMDLRSRGRLSDEVVMKVRSEEAVPYRGVVFDEYNGKGWVISTGETPRRSPRVARASTCSPPATSSPLRDRRARSPRSSTSRRTHPTSSSAPTVPRRSSSRRAPSRWTRTTL